MGGCVISGYIESRWVGGRICSWEITGTEDRNRQVVKRHCCTLVEKLGSMDHEHFPVPRVTGRAASFQKESSREGVLSGAALPCVNPEAWHWSPQGMPD